MVKYCSECGTELVNKGKKIVCPKCVVFCSQCGTENFSNARYCKKCGNSIVQAETDTSDLIEVRTKEKTSASENLVAGKRIEVEDFNLPFNQVFEILEQHMKLKLKKVLVHDPKEGRLAYVISDFSNTSLISAVSGKAGTEIVIQISPISENVTRVMIRAKPYGIVLGPSFTGSRARIKEIFKKLKTDER